MYFKLSNSAFDSIKNLVNEELLDNMFLPSTHLCEKTISNIANLKKYSFDICDNHCIAYTGKLSTHYRCHLCGQERGTANQKKFQIISPRQLLTKRFKSKEFCKLLDYKKQYTSASQRISDVWDSKLIQQLKKEEIVVDGKGLGAYHFKDFRESAIGLATDGIIVFKSQKRSCWPLLLIDYNLPPNVRIKQQFIIHVGVVPGMSHFTVKNIMQIGN